MNRRYVVGRRYSAWRSRRLDFLDLDNLYEDTRLGTHGMLSVVAFPKRVRHGMGSSRPVGQEVAREAAAPIGAWDCARRVGRSGLSDA